MAVKAKEALTIREIEQLKKKAAIFDEFVEFIEDKGLARLMQKVEKEKSISLNEVQGAF